jgi:hypothetical protein
MGSERLMFSAKVLLGSYLPSSGLAAAMTLQRACSCVTMPALLMEMDCCSMASWMDTRSCKGHKYKLGQKNNRDRLSRQSGEQQPRWTAAAWPRGRE